MAEIKPIVVGSKVPPHAIRRDRMYRYYTRMDRFGAFHFVATVGGDILRLHMQTALAPDLFAVQEI